MNRICTVLVAFFICLCAFSQAPLDTAVVQKDSLAAARKDSLPTLPSRPDSLAVDSLAVDSLFNDSAAVALPPDTLVTDSLLADSLLTDSLQKDSLLKDTIISERPPVIIKIDPLDTIRRAYMHRIEKLALKRDSVANTPAVVELDAYYYRLILPPTLYKKAVHGVLTTRDSCFIDAKTQRLHAIHYALSRAYVQYPWLVQQTEDELSNVGTLRNDITGQSIQNAGKLSEKLVEVDLPTEIVDTVQVQTRRPNFWATSGRGTFNFSQSYSSDNWGGTRSYSGLSTLDLTANFNNQRKILWNNSLNARLGFQNARGDSRRAFRPTDNSLRINSNIGYQAWKKLYYSSDVTMNTKIVPQYNTGTDVCNSDFLSPLDMTVGVGLKLTFSIFKKKFNGTIQMSPVSYQMRYVQRERLATGFGVRPGHQSYHKWGPSLNANASWPLAKNINWSTRFTWNSNLSYTSFQWENNFSFQVSKYINATLHIYPRYDDSNPGAKNKNGRYFFFKESLSMGMNYSF
ncbi:MAG: DUF3078 domain-containing protein [Bacteroidaceae bacterium]|nr:DUF3078 domain-containing protein [Bacteroidaceae bacterium]